MPCRDRGVVYQDVDVAVKLCFQRAGDEIRAVGGEDVGGDADKFGLSGSCRVRYARAGGAGEGGEDVRIERPRARGASRRVRVTLFRSASRIASPGLGAAGRVWALAALGWTGGGIC